MTNLSLQPIWITIYNECNILCSCVLNNCNIYITELHLENAGYRWACVFWSLKLSCTQKKYIGIFFAYCIFAARVGFSSKEMEVIKFFNFQKCTFRACSICNVYMSHKWFHNKVSPSRLHCTWTFLMENMKRWLDFPKGYVTWHFKFCWYVQVWPFQMKVHFNSNCFNCIFIVL